MALIGRNTRVEVRSAIAEAVTITGISKAETAVVSAAAHGLANGDIVVIAAQGMTDLDGQIAKVANVTAGTFELIDIDSTEFGDFASGTFSKVSSWITLGTARSLTSGSTTPDKIDATTLLDSEKQYLFGQSEAPEISVQGLSDPLAAAAKVVEKHARGNLPLEFRVTMSDKSGRLFRGYASLPSESIPLGDLVTSDFSVTQIRRRMAYPA